MNIYPLNETQRFPTSWLSIPDRFRPLPRGHHQWTLPLEISRYFYWHTTTFELVNTYDHISRLCNHLWLHYPSDTTWVWTRVSRIWSALVARFEVHATTPTPCLPVIRSSTQCVIVSVPLREHCLTQCYMVLFTQQLHRLMNFVSYLQVSLPGFLSFLFGTASPLTPMSLRRTSGSYL